MQQIEHIVGDCLFILDRESLTIGDLSHAGKITTIKVSDIADFNSGYRNPVWDGVVLSKTANLIVVNVEGTQAVLELVRLRHGE